MDSQKPSLQPVTREFDADVLASEEARKAFSPAMGRGARADAPAHGEEVQEKSPSDQGLNGFGRGAFATNQKLSDGAVLKSFWGTEGHFGSMVILDLAGRPTLTSPYAQDPTYFACVDKLSTAIGQLPIRLERQVVDEGAARWVQVAEMGADGRGRSMKGAKTVKATAEEAKVLRLLDCPNPLHTGRMFRTAIVQHFLGDGETLVLFMSKGMDDQGPRATSNIKRLGAELDEIPDWLWPVGGSRVLPRADNAAGSLPKVFHLSTSEEWPAGGAAWLIKVTPDSSYRGMGPGSPIRRKMEQSYTIDRYNDAMLKNGGQPAGFFYTPNRMTKDAKEALRQSWETHVAGAANAGSLAIIDAGAEFKSAAFKPDEMQHAELEKQNSEYIRMVMGATKPVLGLTDGVNRASAHEAMRVWYEVTVKPLAEVLIDQLSRAIGRMKPLQRVGAKHRLCFDYSASPFLREDLDAKVERTVKIHDSLHVTPRDAARLAGWDAAAESDVAALDDRLVDGGLKPYEVVADPAHHNPAPPSSSAKAFGAGVFEEPKAEQEPEEEPAEDLAALEAKRFAAWKAVDDLVSARQKPTKKAAEKVLKSYVLAARKRLNEIAEGSRAAPSKAAERVAARRQAREGAAPVLKYVANEAEIERALALNLAEWEALMREEVSPELLKTIQAAAEALNLEVSGGDLILQATDPQVVQFMAEKEVTLVEGATSTLAKDVQRKIVKVLAGAEDATSLSEAVREVLEELNAEMKTMIEATGARAEMIARTETASSVSFARTEQMGIDGIERHTWLSSRDGAVRDDHADLEGKTVKVGEEFGFRLHYPGDGSHGADAGAVVNCRCTTLPELD